MRIIHPVLPEPSIIVGPPSRLDYDSSVVLRMDSRQIEVRRRPTARTTSQATQPQNTKERAMPRAPRDESELMELIESMPPIMENAPPWALTTMDHTIAPSPSAVMSPLDHVGPEIGGSVPV